MQDNSQYPQPPELEKRRSIDQEKHPEIKRQGPGVVGSRTARRVMSASVQRLAKRLGKNPDELEIDPDTLRRTKYPVIEIENEDGSIIYKDDPGIEEGPRALYR